MCTKTRATEDSLVSIGTLVIFTLGFSAWRVPNIWSPPVTTTTHQRFHTTPSVHPYSPNTYSYYYIPLTCLTTITPPCSYTTTTKRPPCWPYFTCQHESLVNIETFELLGVNNRLQREGERENWTEKRPSCTHRAHFEVPQQTIPTVLHQTPAQDTGVKRETRRLTHQIESTSTIPSSQVTL